MINITRAKGNLVIPSCRICQRVYLTLLQELPGLLKTHVKADHHPNLDSEICFKERHVRHEWTVQLVMLFAVQLKLAVLSQHPSVSAKGQVCVEEFFVLVERQEVHDNVDFVL